MPMVSQLMLYNMTWDFQHFSDWERFRLSFHHLPVISMFHKLVASPTGNSSRKGWKLCTKTPARLAVPSVNFYRQIKKYPFIDK